MGDFLVRGQESPLLRTNRGPRMHAHNSSARNDPDGATDSLPDASAHTSANAASDTASDAASDAPQTDESSWACGSLQLRGWPVLSVGSGQEDVVLSAPPRVRAA